MRFGSCCSLSFSCSRSSLVDQLFLIAHQQVSGCNLASKMSLSVLLSDGQNLSWLGRFSLFKVFGSMGCSFLTILDVLN